jgi:hypothetical protein
MSPTLADNVKIAYNLATVVAEGKKNKFMTTKNVKIALKPEIHLKQKNFSSSDLIFLGVFKVKKIHDLNSPCHMKPFNKEKKTTVLVVKFLINEHFLLQIEIQ